MSNSITRDAIFNEIHNRGWLVESIGKDDDIYKITDDKGRISIGRGARLRESSSNGVYISKYKDMSYAFVQSLGYRVPDFLVYKQTESAKAFLATHKSIVVKPTDAEQSKGVEVGITTEQQLADAVALATTVSTTGQVLLQQQVHGKLYRILIVNGIFFAAAYRRAPYVVGDGVQTVRQLIISKNDTPLRSASQPTPLKPINIEHVTAFLQERTDEVLAAGTELEVLPVASISVGGEAEDVTDSVHSFYRETSEQIVRALGLSICGIDIMVEDIESPPAVQGFYPLIELNSLPGLKLHLFPTAGGISRDPSAAILDAAFPPTN